MVTYTLKTCQRGISLLELSILTPLLMIFISGMVDLGHALRRQQVVSEAARHGARIGSGRLDGDLCCLAAHHRSQQGGCLRNLPECSELIGSADQYPSAANVQAKKAACDFIRNAGLSPDDWLIQARVIETEDPPFVAHAPEDDSVVASNSETSSQLINVEIRSKPESKTCLLCFLGGRGVTGESSFALENRCSGPVL